jgi:hypothetical protein
MSVLDFEAYKKCSMEIREQKQYIDKLLKLNAELYEKVNDIYGAYETLQYSCEGRCNIYGAEIDKLRKQIEILEGELRKKS